MGASLVRWGQHLCRVCVECVSHLLGRLIGSLIVLLARMWGRGAPGVVLNDAAGPQKQFLLSVSSNRATATRSWPKMVLGTQSVPGIELFLLGSDPRLLGHERYLLLGSVTGHHLVVK